MRKLATVLIILSLIPFAQPAGAQDARLQSSIEASRPARAAQRAALLQQIAASQADIARLNAEIETAIRDQNEGEVLRGAGIAFAAATVFIVIVRISSARKFADLTRELGIVVTPMSRLDRVIEILGLTASSFGSLGTIALSHGKVQLNRETALQLREELAGANSELTRLQWQLSVD